MNDFDTFWDAYPRKVGKETARGAWEATKADRPPIDQLLAAVASAAASEQWGDSKLIPHPSTWLRRHGWHDEHKRAQIDELAPREEWSPAIFSCDFCPWSGINYGLHMWTDHPDDYRRLRGQDRTPREYDGV